MTKSEFSTAWQTAVAHHAAGRLTEAEAFYEAVPTQDPHYPDATHCRGLIAYQRGQYARAAEFIAVINASFKIVGHPQTPYRIAKSAIITTSVII